MIMMFGVPLRDLIPWRRRPKVEPTRQAHPTVAALVDREAVEERDRIDRLTRRQRRAEGLGHKYPRDGEAPIDPKVWDELAEILGDDGFAMGLRNPAELHGALRGNIAE